MWCQLDFHFFIEKLFFSFWSLWLFSLSSMFLNLHPWSEIIAYILLDTKYISKTEKSFLSSALKLFSTSFFLNNLLSFLSSSIKITKFKWNFSWNFWISSPWQIQLFWLIINIFCYFEKFGVRITLFNYPNS